jgi:hypothetical protein
VRRTAIAILAHDRVAAAAPAADQQARQQEAAPMRTVERLATLVAGHGEGQCALAMPHRLPEIRLDDPQLGDLDALAL